MNRLIFLPRPFTQRSTQQDVTPNPELSQVLQFCTGKVHGLGKIPGTYVTEPIVGITDDRITTTKGPIKSRHLAAMASHATRIVFCLLTAGSVLDEKIESSADLLEASIWDAIGTVRVENAVAHLLEKIHEEERLYPSLPFSPGYCDWELTGQQVIFSAFPPRPLGISLLCDSLMMIPQKSISFVAYLDAQPQNQIPCRYCTLMNCFDRWLLLGLG